MPVVVPAIIALAGIIGVVAMAGSASTKDDEIATLEAAMAEAEDERDSARRDAEDLDGQLEDAEDEITDEKRRADEAEDVARTKLETEFADRVTLLDAREADLKAREDALAAREQQLDATLNGLRASQFGDGVHEVGRDIQPGRYHTEGSGDTCYYALLGPDGQDIIDNNNVDGPVTVIINSAFFESARCGTWTKVG